MNIAYEVLSGSRAYGLATENADEDIRGIFLPSGDQLLGFGYRETKEMKPDKVYHSLRKYLHLALKANPSILAWLWVPEDCIRVRTVLSDELRANRERFLSRLVRQTFGGYAMSQLKKMEKSYGLGTGYALHGERDAASDPYSLEAGYDTKNALHLIRLLYCGNKLLNDGEYPVFIEDEDVRRHLMEIRHGEIAFHEVLGEAKRMFNQLDLACESSNLPDEPDTTWVEAFLRKWHRMAITHAFPLAP